MIPWTRVSGTVPGTGTSSTGLLDYGSSLYLTYSTWYWYDTWEYRSESYTPSTSTQQYTGVQGRSVLLPGRTVVYHPDACTVAQRVQKISTRSTGVLVALLHAYSTSVDYLYQVTIIILLLLVDERNIRPDTKINRGGKRVEHRNNHHYVRSSNVR
jgi:hypothetical protein